VTDWDDLAELFSSMRHETTTEYPEAVTGDLWIVEEPFWRTGIIEQAIEEHVHVMLVGTNTRLEEEANSMGADCMLGDNIDPDALIQWVQMKQKERPKIQKKEKRGIMVAFAGLLPTGGGVGKDTLVFNTAAWLAESIEKKVAVVDLDPFGTLKDRFKLDTTMSVDVWKERFMDIPLTPEMVRNALVKVKHLDFWLLPASTDNQVVPDDVVKHMGEWLSQAFDVVIWNLGSGPAGKMFLNALRQSDHIFLVGTGDRAKFKAYRRTLEDYQETVSVEPKVLLNKVYEKDSPRFFEDKYEYEVFAVAMEDRRVFEVTETGKAIAIEQPKRPFGFAVQKIAKEILGEEVINVKVAKKGGFRLW
jgi:pilus assembly protein CpaE